MCRHEIYFRSMFARRTLCGSIVLEGIKAYGLEHKTHANWLNSARPNETKNDFRRSTRIWQ